MKNSIGSNAAGAPRRRHMLAATLGLAVLGSAAFAAAGGVQAVKRWFVTVELDDGKTYNLELVGENPSFKIEDADLGEDVTITLESEDAGAGGTMSITATENEEGGVDVRTNTGNAPGNE